MSYQVLARKWRPRTFSEMVGQEHVLRALINALDNDRLHHAYLFSGTRGVGKTTVARIFAKSLNCETGVTATPCGECTSCREIDEGRFVDLIEVDAASRTKVDETRELLDNVQYAPTRGRYKVYLIDEVHMFSNHSFNALLKTLEEPPPHVKFLLATTEAQKLPVTILSRCLQFNLKRLPQSLIGKQLEHILGAEETEYEAPAVARLARAADGSMRDALSLMDQAIAFAGGGLKDVDVCAMLGVIEQDYVVELLEALADMDAAAVMACVNRMAERAPDFAAVLAEMLGFLQRMALAQALPDAIDDSQGDRDKVLDLAARMSSEDVQLYYQIGLVGHRDLDLAPDPQGGLEMVLLRMLAFRPAQAPTGPVPGPGPRSESVAAKAAPAVAESKPKPISQAKSEAKSAQAPAARDATPVASRGGPPEPAAESVVESLARTQASEPPPAPRRSSAPSPAIAPGADTDPAAEEWRALIQRLNLTGLAREFAMNCELLSRDGGDIKVQLDAALRHLHNPKFSDRLREALAENLGVEVSLSVEATGQVGITPASLDIRDQAARQQAAEDAIAGDPVVRALQDTFDAQVQAGSVRPVE